MDKILEIWATVKQLVTSRTIWGVVVMLVGGLGIQLPGDLGDMIGNAGMTKGQRAVIGGTAALLISLLLWFMIAKALLRGLAIEA